VQQPWRPRNRHCSGPVADGAPIDTSEVGPHPFSVTAVDRAGFEATKTTHYRVLSPGTITLVGPARAFRHKGRIWLDTGYEGACPERGPACAGLVTGHLTGASAEGLNSDHFGHAHVRIRGAKVRALTYRLGKSRGRRLLREKHLRVRFDVSLSRGTSSSATAERTANVAAPR
jgi:hypothetical protein